MNSQEDKAIATCGAARPESGRGVCLQCLIEQQAARSPDGVAVRFAGQCLSYDQLNRRANRLAHYLRELGIGPDCLVGVRMERSI